MVLPQAVAKSTGLRQALGRLRLSIHNTIGIGDAENDHDLLDACEVGVAVAWGSPALRARRRRGDRRHRSRGRRLTTSDASRNSLGSRRRQMGRRRLLLGHQHNGDPVSLAVRGRTVLIAGEPGTGKVVAGRPAVRTADPPGLLRLHHRSGGRLPIARSAAERHHAGRRRSAAGGARTGRGAASPGCQRRSSISRRCRTTRRREYLNTLLPLLITLRRRTGLPHKILLDEAHYYLGGPDSAHAHRRRSSRATSWSPIACPAWPSPSGRRTTPSSW